MDGDGYMSITDAVRLLGHLPRRRGAAQPSPSVVTRERVPDSPAELFAQW